MQTPISDPGGHIVGLETKGLIRAAFPSPSLSGSLLSLSRVHWDHEPFPVAPLPALSPQGGERVPAGRERGWSMKRARIACRVWTMRMRRGVRPMLCTKNQNGEAARRMPFFSKRAACGSFPMNLVAADVSWRTCLLSRQRISADSRRRLRFRGSTRESSRGNPPARNEQGERGN
jgi:hypothetical protein